LRGGKKGGKPNTRLLQKEKEKRIPQKEGGNLVVVR